MKDTWKASLLVSVSFFVTLLVSPDGESHHSHAMFDHSSEVTLTGTVTNYSFRNPHVYLYLDVEGERGEVIPWSIEMSNIENMVRRGVLASTFRIGDVITVTVNPLDNGGHGGNYVRVTAADGRTYE